jgi:hypothetical protein
VQLRVDLVTSKKQDLSAADFYRKITGLASELAAIDTPLRDEEILAYLFVGLPIEYDPFVTAMTTKTEALSLDDVFAHLVSFEDRLLRHQAELQQSFGASANYAGRGGRGRGHGDRGRGTRERGGGAPNVEDIRATDLRVLSAKSAKNSAILPSDASTAWMNRTRKRALRPMSPPTPTRLMPTGTTTLGGTDHITSDLARLTMREQYHGADSVQVGNNVGLRILHTGSCSLNTTNRPLALTNVLHVPKNFKHLLSVHKLTRDNNVFFEFHPWNYFIKDRATRKLLLEGRCESGLYPIKSSAVKSLRHALVSHSVRPDQWHARLGHPTLPVVRSILRLNNLSCSKEPSESSVCNACQLAKSHQLPYKLSIHRTTAPLELIHSDVWGPAPVSVGCYKYYISFIDYFTKFTWLYLMKDRTEAQHIFRLFQAHVERLLNTKIEVSNLTGVGNIKNCTPKFSLP